MAYIDMTNVKEEMENFLRNSDIISTATRGVTTTTQTFSAAGGAQTFTLANTNVKNVRSVTVNAVAITFGTDYTLNLDSAQVIVSKVLIAADAVVVSYDYGSSDKIFSDFPRMDLSISSFPRMGFDITGIDSEDIGFGNVLSSDIEFQINVYDADKKEMDNYLDVTRKKIIDARDNFFYMKRLIPVGTTPLIKPEWSKEKVFQKGLLIRSILNYEIQR